MLFGMWTRVSAKNHVLEGGPDPPRKDAILRGEKGRPIVKYREYRPCAAVMRPFVNLLWPLVISMLLLWWMNIIKRWQAGSFVVNCVCKMQRNDQNVHQPQPRSACRGNSPFVRFSCDQPVIDQRRSNTNRVMYYLIEPMLVDAELADRDGSALLRRRTGSLGWREHRPHMARRRIHSAILSQPEPEVVRATPPAPRHASSVISRPGATSAVSSRENWKTGRQIEINRERERERERGHRGDAARLHWRFATIKWSRIVASFPSLTSITVILGFDLSDRHWFG